MAQKFNCCPIGRDAINQAQNCGACTSILVLVNQHNNSVQTTSTWWCMPKVCPSWLVWATTPHHITGDSKQTRQCTAALCINVKPLMQGITSWIGSCKYFMAEVYMHKMYPARLPGPKGGPSCHQSRNFKTCCRPAKGFSNKLFAKHESTSTALTAMQFGGWAIGPLSEPPDAFHSPCHFAHG